MLELLEQQKSLTINQWKIFLACFFSLALDFFDFFLISFVLAFFVRDWNLTYDQSALILLSSGVASVPAGYFFGWLGDRIGRRKVFMINDPYFFARHRPDGADPGARLDLRPGVLRARLESDL